MKFFLPIFLLLGGFLLAYANPEANALADSLYQSCLAGNCEFQITTKDHAITEIQVSKSKTPAVRTECVELCSACFTDSLSSSNCLKVEKFCQCSDIISRKKIQDSLSTVDSFDLELARLESTQIAAGKILHAADSLENISIQLRLDESTLKIQNFQIEISSEQTAVTAVKTDSAETVSKEPVQQEELANNEQKNDEPKKEEPPQRSTFAGITIGYGLYESLFLYDNSKYLFESVDEYFHEILVGFIVRSYFLKYFSFSTGIHFNASFNLFNTDYHSESYSKYASVEITFTKYFIEFPLELRFSIPITRIVQPFLSYSLIVRKPLSGNLEFKAEAFEYDILDKNISVEYNIQDWDFFGYFGFGLEISRHFSLEYQCTGFL